MDNEKYLIGFEALPIAVAGFLLAAFHPGLCFNDEKIEVQLEKMPESPTSYASSAWASKNKEPMYTVRRWNQVTGKPEVVHIYDEHDPRYRNW